MKLEELETATGISKRTIRYVVEQQLVPNIGQIKKPNGRDRDFTPLQSVKISMAAMLHIAGFRGEQTRQIIQDTAGAVRRRADDVVLRVSPCKDACTKVEVTIELSPLYKILKLT